MKCLTNFVQDDDMGSDFDDAEDHVQDSSKYKVKCGFETIDHMLSGWDIYIKCNYGSN
jgi:hypothetical protein